MIRAWIADEAGARPVDAAEAVECALRGTAIVWIDIANDDDAVRETLAPLQIHPLVLEDIASQVNRPKVDDYGSYLYLVLHSARWEADRATLREIDVVIGERYLVTCHDGTSTSIASTHDVLSRRSDLLKRGPVHLLYFILDQLVDHYFPILDTLGVEIDALEEAVFEQYDERGHRRVIRLKRGMAALRRIIGPQRDTLLALTRDEFRPIPAEMRPYLRDIYDRLARLGDLLDTYRDETAALLELQVSIASNRMNEIIKRLTVIATIGLPFTVITSYYGMNFNLVEYRWPHAWAYVFGLIAASGLLIWLYLKHKRLL